MQAVQKVRRNPAAAAGAVAYARTLHVLCPMLKIKLKSRAKKNQFFSLASQKWCYFLYIRSYTAKMVIGMMGVWEGLECLKEIGKHTNGGGIPTFHIPSHGPMNGDQRQQKEGAIYHNI